MAENNKTQSVTELVNEINQGRSQTSSSAKDEVRVMKAMLNDKGFEVNVYDKTGVVGTYCPAKDARSMIANVISATAKIPSAEAEQLAENYEFKRSDANSFIGISKEFVNTFIQTGRKLPLGGRETSNISLSVKHVAETTKPYPVKVGINEDGTARFTKGQAPIKAHDSIKVFAPCPPWVK